METLHDQEAFHEGERLMQERVGVRQRMSELGHQFIRDYMPDQHRQFFTQLPFIVVGSTDATGQPWASVLSNPPGFIYAPDNLRLQIRALPMQGDPLGANLQQGADLALLGIEQQTRRRNRMNGVVSRMAADGFEVSVRQSFGNCPKYIQSRRAEYVVEDVEPVVTDSAKLNQKTRNMITQADTLFIATAHSAANHSATHTHTHGCDVSHRGGKPGFVRVDGDDTLTMPDFAGNKFFNTLGNIAVNPRVGLLFIDFENGDLLYVAAEAEIIFDGSELASFAGAERLLRFKISQVRHVSSASGLRWSKLVDESPFLVSTGSWI